MREMSRSKATESKIFALPLAMTLIICFQEIVEGVMKGKKLLWAYFSVAGVWVLLLISYIFLKYAQTARTVKWLLLTLTFLQIVGTVAMALKLS